MVSIGSFGLLKQGLVLPVHLLELHLHLEVLVLQLIMFQAGQPGKFVHFVPHVHQVPLVPALNRTQLLLQSSQRVPELKIVVIQSINFFLLAPLL